MIWTTSFRYTDIVTLHTKNKKMWHHQPSDVVGASASGDRRPERGNSAAIVRLSSPHPFIWTPDNVPAKSTYLDRLIFNWKVQLSFY